jgi:hypothetical protein
MFQPFLAILREVFNKEAYIIIHLLSQNNYYDTHCTVLCNLFNHLNICTCNSTIAQL